jgi:predicted permease
MTMSLRRLFSRMTTGRGGAPDNSHDAARDARGLPRLDRLRQDVRYALRGLCRDWRFSLVATLTLALGIGATTAIFSLLRGVVLDPLPYPNPTALVRVFEWNRSTPSFPVSPWSFVEYRRLARALDLAVYTREDLQLAGDGRPERLRAMQVSAEYFRVLGTSPVLGRAFTRSEERADARVVILSGQLWRTRFGADPAVVGRTTRLNAQAFTIVGVMPAGFQHVGGIYRSLPHGETVDAWWPVPLDHAKDDRHSHYLNGVGRLQDGASAARAAGELDTIEAGLDPSASDSDRWHVRAVGLKDEIVGGARQSVLLLMAAVVTVLLIACVNVAGLLLARGTARRRELAVRLALGANRARLVRQSLTESAVLMIPGAALGMLVALAGVAVLVALLPGDFPRLQNVRVDLGVLLFSAVVSGVAVIAFGLFPAWQQACEDPRCSLQDSGTRTGAARHTVRVRGVLVASEVALASMLLVCAGLLLRSFVALEASPAGFVPERVLTFQIALQGEQDETVAGVPRSFESDRANFVARLLDAIRSTPGVVSAGASSDLPWTGYDENSSFGIVGQATDLSRGGEGRYHVATDGFFNAIRIPLIDGRLLTQADRTDSPLVVVVNKALAERYLQGRAVGKVLDVWGKRRTIVGVVGDVKDTPASAAAEPAFWFPHAQMPFPLVTLAVRTSGEPLALAGSIRQAVRALDSEMAVADLKPLTDIADAANAERRFLLVIVALFAVSALLLAAVGAYGVLAWTVQQRARELGIRTALGAQRVQLLVLVLGQGLRLATAGLIAGLLTALVSGHLLQALLYGVTPRDPLTFVVVGAATLAVATAASLLPALQATRANPSEVLRLE